MKKPCIVIFVVAVFSLVFAGCPEDDDPCSHEWEWVETTAPTEAEAGEETYTCLICDETGEKRTLPAIITSVNINIGEPINGGTPSSTASGTGNFTIDSVLWSPNGSFFLGGKIYTTTIILTVNSGYTFTRLNSATINGQNAVILNNTGTAVTLSYTFTETLTKTVTGIAVKTQPTNLTYTHGDQLNLAGLVVTLTYSDTTAEDVAVTDFTAKNITASPDQDDDLVHLTHNDQPVTITYIIGTTQLITTTDNLTVNKAKGSFDSPAAVNITYTPDLTLEDLSLPEGYTWDDPSTTLSVGEGQTFAATYIDPSGNYESATDSITVNVAKASGTFGSPAAINTTYTPTLKLSDLTLPAGYTWNVPTTILNAGNNQLFAATYTDPSGNYLSASGNITVNVANASGIFGNPAAIDTTYTPTLKLSDLALPAGYTWNVPTTVLNVGDNQSFAATYTDPDSNYEPASGNITVNVAKAVGTFGSLAVIDITYTPTLKLSDLTLPAGYTWNNPSTALSVGDNQSFEATYTDSSGNYLPASGNVTVNVAKASGTFVSPAAINTTYTPTLKLSDLALPAGYTWDDPSTTLSVGDGQPFAATYIDPSGNYESATGSITVNVAKASGIFGSPAAIYTTYTSTLKLSDLTLPEGYVWNNPSTVLNAGDNQLFTATYTDPSGNYLSANGNVTVNINKANGAMVEELIPIASINSITINAVPAPDNGQTVEYAISTNTTVPVSGWQDGLTFSGLNGNTMYFVFARSKENTNYNAGTAVSVDILTHSGFTVNFTQPGDEEIDLNISSNIPLSQAANDYIDISIVQTFNSVRWYIDGELDATHNNESSIRVYATGLNTGICSITAVVYDGSAWYSKWLTFTVGK